MNVLIKVVTTIVSVGTGKLAYDYYTERKAEKKREKEKVSASGAKALKMIAEDRRKSAKQVPLKATQARTKSQQDFVANLMSK